MNTMIERNKDSEYEKWRERRREEWTKYKDDYATNDIQYIFQKITSLSDDIIKSNEDTPLQLWIDNIVDKLMENYYSIKETINEEKISTVLINIGFNPELIKQFKHIDDDLSSHFTYDEIIEIIIDSVLYEIE